MGLLKKILLSLGILWMAGFLFVLVNSHGVAGYKLVYTSGASMEPTLKNGTLCLLKKGSSRIARGDIISFELADGRKVIKRVVGLPGERLEIKYNSVYINGRPLIEDYLPSGSITYWERLCCIAVPEDCVFVLGDNREESCDSRNFGPVPLTKVEGVVVRTWENRGVILALLDAFVYVPAEKMLALLR